MGFVDQNLNMKLRSLFISCALAASVQAADKPNIVFFLVDDMGTQDTSVPFYQNADGKFVTTDHNKLYRTPNMEKLAENGRMFTRAYAYSVCSPTRVTLMTGQAAPRHKVTTWTHPKTHKTDPGLVKTKTIKSPKWNQKGVPENITLLPHILKKSGYTSLFAGKAHFGPDDTPNGNPLNLGFDVNIAGFGGGGPGSYYGKENYSARFRGETIWDVPGLEKYHGTDTYLTEAITIEMNAAITKTVEKKKPFFAYMSHYAVHAPFLHPDPRFKKNYPTLKGHGLAFATLVEGMDKSLGDMVAHLEKLGVAEDTLIVFYSDNGSASPLWTKTLRDKKGSRFEGGTRVPLIVAWAKPNSNNKFQKALPIPKGTVDNHMVTCLDMLPTFANLTGSEKPKDAIWDGYDVSSYFMGKNKVERKGGFLVHFPHRHQNTLFSNYLVGDEKIIYNYSSKKWEMYNIKTDPKEGNNLVQAHPAKALKLAKMMIAELDSQNANYPLDVNTNKPVKPDLSTLPTKTAKSVR